MKKQTNDKTLIIIAAIIGLAIVAYGYFNYQAKMEVIKYDRQNKETEERKVLNNEMKINDCIRKAEINYQTTWESNCKAKNLGINCGLPSILANGIEETLNNAKDVCLKLYK